MVIIIILIGSNLHCSGVDDRPAWGFAQRSPQVNFKLQAACSNVLLFFFSPLSKSYISFNILAHALCIFEFSIWYYHTRGSKSQKADDCEDQPLFLMWNTRQDKTGDDLCCWVSPPDEFCINGRSPGYYSVNKQASVNQKG